MGDFSKLRADIQAQIKPNGEGAITGQVMQDTLLSVVDTTDAKLTELSERIDDIADLEKISEVGIHLSDIYGFVGDTIQVFFNSIIENYENYVIKIDCKYGKIYPKYYECTPSVECNEPLTISVYTNNGVLLASKEVRLVATSAKNATSAKRVLIIGDSTIQNGEVAIEMSRRLKGTSGVASSPSPMALSNYAITGRIKNADGSVGWEGIGGWRWDEYLGSAGNPGARLYVDGVTDINVGDRFKLEGFTQEFLISEKNITNGVGYVYATFYGQGDIYKNHSLMPTDGTMTKVVGSGVASFAFSNARVESYQPLWNTDTNQWDILGYCNEHCGGAVHCICTQLGINSLGRDAFGSYADIADKVRLFLDRTHSQMPNCIVLLGKIMLPSQMGGLGKDYTTNDQFGNYNAEGFNVKIHQYNAILESIANEEKYSSFVKVVDLCSQFDAVNNYPTFEKQVNTRNPQKEALGGNGVHPNNYGYWQVADAWIRAIVNVMIQKHTPVEVTYQVTTPDGKLFSDYVKSNFKVAGDLSAQIEIVDIDAKQYNGLNYIAVKKGDIMVATKDAAATSYQVGFATSLENGTPITPASAYPTPSGESTFTCPSDGYYLWYGGASNPFNFVQKIVRTTME